MEDEIYDDAFEPAEYADDDFPLYLEYDGLWGVSDWMAEDAAMREAEFEAEYFGFGGEE